MTQPTTLPATHSKRNELAVKTDESLSPSPPTQVRSFMRRSQADLEDAIVHYPEPAKEPTIWAQNFCREACKGNIELLRAIVEKIGYKYSLSYFSNVLYGYYFTVKRGRVDGNVDTWVEIVDALKKHDRQSTASGKTGFIETPTYKCFYDFIVERRAPGAACRFGGITGPTGSQKSECLKYYKVLYNHGRTYYFEAPARKSLITFQRKLANQFGSQIKDSAVAREAEIRRNITEDKCIIIDNAQRLFFPHKRGNLQPIFDYLLELQDDTKCTIILCFTEDFVKGDLEAGRAKNYFEQFIGRMGGISDLLRLPEFTPKADLRVIAKAFNLNPGDGAIDYLTAWSRLPGRVRLVFQRLKRARTFAQIEGRDRITLADMKEANDFIPPSDGNDSEEEDAS